MFCYFVHIPGSTWVGAPAQPRHRPQEQGCRVRDHFSVRLFFPHIFTVLPSENSRNFGSEYKPFQSKRF